MNDRGLISRYPADGGRSAYSPGDALSGSASGGDGLVPLQHVSMGPAPQL